MGWLVEKALTFCWGEMGEVDVDADVNGMLGEAVPARSSQIGVVLCRVGNGVRDLCLRRMRSADTVFEEGWCCRCNRYAEVKEVSV